MKKKALYKTVYTKLKNGQTNNDWLENNRCKISKKFNFNQTGFDLVEECGIIISVLLYQTGCFTGKV